MIYIYCKKSLHTNLSKTNYCQIEYLIEWMIPKCTSTLLT